MSLSSALRKAFVPSALAFLTTFATMSSNPAYAVEMGPDGCLPPEKLMAQLKAEGQGSVIVGQRIVPKSEKHPEDTTVLTFSTALKSGEFGAGYSFEADKPNGESGFKFCLSGEYDKARALDVSVAEIPSGVASDSNLAKSIRHSIQKDGFNPIFYGEKNGAVTVVVGNPLKKNQLNGTILVGNNGSTNKKAGDQGGMMGLGYSPSYIDGLRARSQQTVAAADMLARP